MMDNNHNTYDVIIIGAGSVGTPTAYFMAKAGLRVLVLTCTQAQDKLLINMPLAASVRRTPTSQRST